MRAKTHATLGLTLLLAGCYSLNIGQDPRPLRPGRVRLSVGTPWNLERPLPYLQLGARIGLGARTELRLRMMLPQDGQQTVVSGVEGGINVQAYRGERFSVFVMPNYRLVPWAADDDDAFGDEDSWPDHRVQALAVPTLFVFDLSPVVDAFVGPDIHAGTRDQSGFLALGGHIGLSISTPGDHLSFVPELSLLTGVAGHGRIDREAQNQLLLPGDVLAELGLSVNFGMSH